MKKKNRRKVQRMAMAGVLLALILIFLFVPIPSISGVSYAVIPLIAVVIACQFDGLLMGLFCGLSFGLLSLIGAFTTGSGSLLAVAFRNPLISVLPRVMIPITCYFSYIGLRKFFKFLYSHRKKYNEKVANHLSKIVSSAISSGIAVFTNTALVMGLIYAFHAGDVIGGETIGTTLLWAIIAANAPFEFGFCILVVPAVLIALKATFHQLNDKYSFKNPNSVVLENIESESISGNKNAELSENHDNIDMNIEENTDNMNSNKEKNALDSDKVSENTLTNIDANIVNDNNVDDSGNND